MRKNWQRMRDGPRRFWRYLSDIDTVLGWWGRVASHLVSLVTALVAWITKNTYWLIPAVVTAAYVLLVVWLANRRMLRGSVDKIGFSDSVSYTLSSPTPGQNFQVSMKLLKDERQSLVVAAAGPVESVRFLRPVRARVSRGDEGVVLRSSWLLRKILSVEEFIPGGVLIDSYVDETVDAILYPATRSTPDNPESPNDTA